MAEREIETDAARRAAGLHLLAHDIVDGRDVVGIDGVAQAEHPGEQRGRHHRRPLTERCEGPGPGRDVGRDQPAEQQHHSGLDRPQRPSRHDNHSVCSAPSHEQYDLFIRWSY
jgi:hypothetical protein